jgi:hypothetical protein
VSLSVTKLEARNVKEPQLRFAPCFKLFRDLHHADVFDFIDLRKNHGKEESYARDLVYALWIPDLLYVSSASVTGYFY